MKTGPYLRALAPYIAVVPFWWIWPNAWFAILAYHTQIVIWNRTTLRTMHLPRRFKHIRFALPAALAGPMLYMMLPFAMRTDLSAWLHTYHLSGPSLMFMIPYFGLVHPVLEQIHWHPLRETSAWFHIVFAGYHMIVLASLLSFPWLILGFAVLAGASYGWKLMAVKSRSLSIPVISHSLADLGVVVAAWARTL